MSNDPEFDKLLVEYIDFYEETCGEEVSEDKYLLDNSDDIISEFIKMFDESLCLGQRERIFWLMSRYGAKNNFKLLIEWINYGLANSSSLEKQDNLGQSQENIIRFLIEKGALKIQNIQKMITVLQRREINGFSDRPRKLLEFHLKRIQQDEIKDMPKGMPEIKEKLEEAFKFMLETDPRTHRQILSASDYKELIDWITFYFTKNFSLPQISMPIKSVNTAKGNVIYTFILFFKTTYPGHRRPDSLFELIKACFQPYSNDKIENLKKTKRPQYYESLNKYGKN
jgi:hypothetical protein